MTASTPAASAERNTAPKLPGFSTLSKTTTNGILRQLKLEELLVRPHLGNNTFRSSSVRHLIIYNRRNTNDPPLACPFAA